MRTNVRTALAPKHFHTLPIIDYRKTTADCAVITFGISPALAETFAYQAGQYVTVHAIINGESVRRSYSICSAPSSGRLSIGVKKIAGGLFSSYANDIVKTGDTLDVMAPMGSFVLPVDTAPKHILYIAAGSGITPILSHLEEHLSQNPNINASLVYGNRSNDSTLFKSDIDELKDRYMSRISVYPIYSKEKVGIPLFHGRIDGERCTKIFKGLIPVSIIDAAYICGPGEMIFAAKDALVAQGMAADKIHYELFTTEGMTTTFKTDSKPVEQPNYDPAKYSQVTIKVDGEILDFALAYGGQNILDAALANGADLPYACKGGVCSTCKAHVADGEVVMSLNYSLEPDEIKRGFTLTCQAHPRTEKVFIDFDQK